MKTETTNRKEVLFQLKAPISASLYMGVLFILTFGGCFFLTEEFGAFDGFHLQLV
jgi:hypothetical protein